MSCELDKDKFAAAMELPEHSEPEPDNSEKDNLKGTEESSRKVANFSDDVADQDPDVTATFSVLTDNKIDDYLDAYELSYIELKHYVENSVGISKYELRMVLYPVLVHMYLELVYSDHSDRAIALMKKFGPEQEDYYLDDLALLATATRREHVDDNVVAGAFMSSQFVIRMSRDTLSLLKRHFSDKKRSVLLNILEEYLYFDVYEGVARNKAQIDATSGAVGGEARREDNATKVYFGIPQLPNLHISSAPVDQQEDNPDKPKKKIKRLALWSKKFDPNAPPKHRVPVPDLKDRDKSEKLKSLGEALRRVDLTTNLPSCYCYTLHNANYNVCCAEIADDSSMLAVGFNDSIIKVFTLVPQKLQTMKPSDRLSEVDVEAEDVLVTMMDERSNESARALCGHSGAVYSVSFSPDRTVLLSCSEDATIRLWSLQMWTCLVVYSGHLYPVWDVKFSPHGYYFASTSYDRTARLWATDQHQPLRIFAGHFSDVDCVQFHPNANYLATGSSDRRVVLWDVTTGNHVRLLTGHKKPIRALAFSVCGRFLASASDDCRVLIWDLSHGHLVAELTGHEKTIHCLAFSRCGSVLVSGGMDCAVKLWNFAKLMEEASSEEASSTEASSMEASSMEASSMEASSMEASSMEASSKETSSEETSSKEPSSEEASSKESSSKETSSKEPSSEEASLKEPSSEEASSKEPSSEEVSSKEPSSEEASSKEASSKETSSKESSSGEASSEEASSLEDFNVSYNPDVKTGDAYLKRTFKTKKSPLIKLHFTRRNLMMAVAVSDGEET